ncbi:MAG: hypothetical protein LKI24_09585 [Acidipropionibacterium sp.]|jgi:hypothetical protein|nr:hypothetical protein [Acidipropionibacterium sp.]
MANLTITVDDDTLRRARIRAIERGESVNRYLSDRLIEYAQSDSVQERRRRAARAFVEFSRTHSGTSAGAGWTRDDLYEEDDHAEDARR